MAKKATEETALPQRMDPGAMAVPDFIPTGASTGAENIGKDDIQMPRLTLAQKMSYEIDESHDAFIEGLKVGQLFNNLTKMIYGKGPLRFMIIRADKPRWVEFIPREEGGGIKDFNVPANDPRTQFGPNGEKPAATKFYDYVIMLLDFQNELIALSLKGTALKTARKLNGLVKNRMPPVPLYAGIYTMWTDTATNPKGTYCVYKVDNAGFPPPNEEGKALFKLAQDLHESLAGKEIKFDREPGEDDDIEDENTQNM